ncbi:MAG: spherulation-specific family 4 protein, partial [Alkalispirochaeta sp.]
MTERASIPGVVIPLYVYPGGDGARAWDAVAAAARQSSDVPIIVVVNPDNGPGARTDANYRSRTQGLADAGVELVAYVALGYGHRPASEIRADLRRWRRLYRSVTGVFFDEVPVPGDHLPRRDARRYLSDLTAYARGRGFSGTVIGNPGTPA